MLRIKNRHISINRGEEGAVRLVSNVPFSVGDQFVLSVVEAGDMTKVVQTFTYTVDTENVVQVIPITKEQNRFAPISNKEIVYWYEIELNGNTTLVGYDSYGPKLFTVYPEVIGGSE